MKFKPLQLVKDKYNGEVLVVGGYDMHCFPWHPKDFFEEGNEERGWLNEDDFELVVGEEVVDD